MQEEGLVNAAHLKQARRSVGLTQQEAAGKMGVSQAYLSMLESGKRTLPTKLARRLADLYGVETQPPPVNKRSAFTWTEDAAAKQLGGLGYPGFSYLRPKRKRNPAELLRWALSQEVLDARLAEAMPWVALHYSHTVDWTWLTNRMKLNDRQNRLGFVVTVAQRLAEQHGFHDKVQPLRQVAESLEGSRLVKEDNFFEQVRSARMRNWLREQQTPEAKHWNVLTDFGPETVRYVQQPAS